MIKTVNLQKVFRTEEVQTLALNNVNIEVNEGEFVAIIALLTVLWQIRRASQVYPAEVMKRE